MTSRNATIALFQLAAESRLGFDAMLTQEKLSVDFSSTDKQVLFSTTPSFAAAQNQTLLQREIGSVQEAVSANRCVEIEPALVSSAPSITGAIYTPSECAADCQKACDGLQTLLTQSGVRFLLGTPIDHINVSGSKVVSIKTPHGDIEADRYVMALDVASASMARSFGVTLPIYPLKGYNITPDVDEAPNCAPTVSVTDSARKMVFAKIGSRLRVAGIADACRLRHEVAPNQIEPLKASTQALFPLGTGSTGCKSSTSTRLMSADAAVQVSTSATP